MAKEARVGAWNKYLELKRKGGKKKGSPLISWGWISVDLDRLDTVLMRQLPGQELKQFAGVFNLKDLSKLASKLKGKKSGGNEIEIYSTVIVGKVCYFYWTVTNSYVAIPGQGQVDFEGTCARMITDEMEIIYTSGGESVEDVRARDKTGGFVLEHGTEGTGQALKNAAGDPELANKRLRGLKAQKEVIEAFRHILEEPQFKKYSSYLEHAIFDFLDTNLTLTHQMRKNRSVKDISDLWQGEASITLGKEIVPNSSIPKNSRRVDNVIRKAFTKYIESKDFLRDVLSAFQGTSLREKINLVKASVDIDEALVNYGAGAFAGVFTKSGKLDKRYKINKKLLALAKPDKKSNKGKSSLKSLSTKRKQRRASGGTGGSRAQKHHSSTDQPLALRELINAALPDEILQRMGSPALNNRTGRFRQSARVLNVITGPKGGIQIDYTYQRNPYGVFEPGSGSPLANQYRDPRRIIGQSIREIAQELIGKKFVKVRRV